MSRRSELRNEIARLKREGTLRNLSEIRKLKRILEALNAEDQEKTDAAERKKKQRDKEKAQAQGRVVSRILVF